MQVPVVVVTSFPDAVPEALETALESIKSSKYSVVLGNELVNLGEELTREESALVRRTGCMHLHLLAWLLVQSLPLLHAYLPLSLEPGGLLPRAGG